jgi:hypothetical protein
MLFDAKAPLTVLEDEIKTAENRRYPRAHINRRALLRNAEGLIVPATATDISVGGVGLRCEPSKAYLLHFGGDSLSQRQAPLLQVKLTLPMDGGLAELDAQCRLYYFSPEGSSDVAVRLRFEKLDSDMHLFVKRFVRETRFATKAMK